MTPEERYKKIDAHIEAAAKQLRLTASRIHASEARTEKMDKRIDKLLTAVEADAENIRALARIAEGRDRKN